MKILKVSFKNLNSLTGEWEIDFTHPAYANDGLFAITGPTGAGKSTLLDSICLALYGSTPRLGRITQSGNEILARGTGECLAEVTFETQAGRYRCCWSQRRARRHPDGAWQSPTHEIVHADTGELIDSTLRGVIEQVESKTGMDFDRFTRSMLLAQGGFAAFLQAKPDERAPILEQITGTAIYSQISMHVHEIRAQHRGNLEKIQSELGALQLLSDEEELQLTDSLARNEAEDSELRRQFETAQAAIAWLEMLTKFESDLNRLGAQQTALQERVIAFEPDRQRLLLAEQALEFDGNHAALEALRIQLHSESANAAQQQEALPKLTQAVEDAAIALNGATLQLAAAKVELQKQGPLLQQVSALDLRIQEKESPIAAANKTLAAAMQGQLDAQRQLKSRQQESLLALETQRSVCERWNNLHLLIGSADGKKFRNFAQGLTFERMVALANLQLRKLTDRYLLFHDSTQPLELQVVDSYQADQVRSTRNLSGGESFLVSLALALGLSHMASRNVRVDSLFLDEGFGTLDEDTLQMALDTLSSLQQEGKLIGVISHIAALKEQIRTQIQVEPQTEGRSALIGPGCRLL
jgi:exonuclease SbcC